jgi:hypothetical protein
MIPFETVLVENCFKTNGDVSNENVLKIKTQFGKQWSPFRQLSILKLLQTTLDSKKIETHFSQLLKDVLSKIEPTHLLIQMPFAQFSRKQSSILRSLQR